MGPQPQLPLPEATGGDKYVALVSGLSVGDEAGEPARVSLLVDYLAGLLGSPPEQEQVAKVRCTATTIPLPEPNRMPQCTSPSASPACFEGQF